MRKSKVDTEGSAKDLFGRALATLSLVISIGGTIFTIYQWHYGEVNRAVQEAVQLSSDEEKDSGIMRLRTTYLDFMNNRNINDQNRVDKGAEAAFFLMHLDLLARRINAGTLNEDYISFMVKCEIFGNYRTVYLQKSFKAGVIPAFLPKQETVPNLAEFYRRHQNLPNC
jgi:hypothetical protein